MSKYTTEVRYICEVNAGLTHSEGYNSINQIIAKSREKIFDFEYPIFDPAYKPILESKILKHYYTREIGCETVGLWKHYLDMKLNEIMPYYNRLYLSEALSFNPFYDVDLTRERKTDGKKEENGLKVNDNIDNIVGNVSDIFNSVATTSTNENGNSEGNREQLNSGSDYTENEGTSNTSENRETTSLTGGEDVSAKETVDGGTQSDVGSNVNKNVRWDVYSDTPQGTLDDVDDLNYLTNARKITDDGTGSTTANTTTFGKTVNETNNTQYGKTNNESSTVGNEKTENSLNTTTYGRNVNETDNNNYGINSEEINDKNDDRNIQKEENRKFNGEEKTKGDMVTTEQFLEHVYGKTPGASYSKLLDEYRKTFINIDMMVINELSDLFFGLW